MKKETTLYIVKHGQIVEMPAIETDKWIRFTRGSRTSIINKANYNLNAAYVGLQVYRKDWMWFSTNKEALLLTYIGEQEDLIQGCELKLTQEKDRLAEYKALLRKLKKVANTMEEEVKK